MLQVDDILAFKMVATCVIWLFSVLGSLSIYIPSLFKAHNNVVTMIVCGIFLIGAILHTNPTIVENASFEWFGIEFMIFPLAYTLYAIGYLFVLTLEMLSNWIATYIGTKSNEKVIPVDSMISQATNLHVDQQNSTREQAILLFSVLSLHALLEGVGIGIARQQAWTTFSSVLAHKIFSSVALVVELHHHTNIMWRIGVSLLLASCMTPIGIILGAITPPFHYPMQEIAIVLAWGISLHIFAMDISKEEDSMRIHVYAILVGVISICSLLLLCV